MTGRVAGGCGVHEQLQFILQHRNCPRKYESADFQIPCVSDQEHASCPHREVQRTYYGAASWIGIVLVQT